MGFWPIVKKVVREADILLLVLDARMPGLSRNPVLEEMIKKENKESVLVFTKIDLISSMALNKLREKFKGTFFVSGVKNIGMRKLKIGLMIKAKRIGIESPKIGVVGYPNVGKSAIINALAKRAKTSVSSRAGTTKGIQWVNAGRLRVLDSPGVVPMKDTELNLGLLGSKNPEKMKRADKVAFAIIREFFNQKKEGLENFYGVSLDEKDDVCEVLAKIGRAKGFLVKGGKIDENRVIFKLIRDWQSGKLKL